MKTLKLKHIVTVLLLIFVVVSIAYAVVREVREATSRDVKPIAINPTINPNEVDQAFKKVVVYYFHTTARCDSCKTIEAYSHEVVTTKFKKELDNGTVEWQVINIDRPEHQHFIQDYQLTAMSLVLVQKSESAQLKWKNLNEVWHHVDEKETFFSYVENELKDMLKDVKH